MTYNTKCQIYSLNTMIRFTKDEHDPASLAAWASSCVYYCRRIDGTRVQFKIVLTPHISQKHNTRGSHFYSMTYNTP